MIEPEQKLTELGLTPSKRVTDIRDKWTPYIINDEWYWVNTHGNIYVNVTNINTNEKNEIYMGNLVPYN